MNGVLVTGANGFVGTAVVERLVRGRQYSVRGAVRNDCRAIHAGAERVVGTMTSTADWQPLLADIRTVVHLAARVHVMRDTVADPLAAFRETNVAATLRLARQAAAAGVERFVYLSSVKVHGETGTFVETDPLAPEDAYGASKQEAETGLREVAAATSMQLVIVRPPLVYGPGVRANFLALMRAVARGVPLPFGAVHNQRSLIGLDNLVDFILHCIEHPSAANETFLVSDGEDLSTTDLIRRLALAMHQRARLLPVPVPVLMAVAALVGRQDVARRVLGSLRVDIAKARQRLQWTPPFTVDEELRRTAATLS